MIANLNGPFIGGKTPNQADAFLATMLYWSHNALECGLSLLPQAPTVHSKRLASAIGHGVPATLGATTELEGVLQK